MTEATERPPAERIKRYRAFADVARRQAEKNTGGMREAYLLMAERWDNLADLTLAETKSEE